MSTKEGYLGIYYLVYVYTIMGAFMLGTYLLLSFLIRHCEGEKPEE
jgi:hypothetical protein